MPPHCSVQFRILLELLVELEEFCWISTKLVAGISHKVVVSLIEVGRIGNSPPEIRQDAVSIFHLIISPIAKVTDEQQQYGSPKASLTLIKYMTNR